MSTGLCFDFNDTKVTVKGGHGSGRTGTVRGGMTYTSPSGKTSLHLLLVLEHAAEAERDEIIVVPAVNCFVKHGQPLVG